MGLYWSSITATSRKIISRLCVDLGRHRALRFAMALLALIPGVLLANSRDVSPVTPPSSPDVILVLNGSFWSRFPPALDLLRKGAAKRMIVDGSDSQTTFGKTVADRELDVARTQGSIANKIGVCRVTADSTAEEAVQIDSCLNAVHAHNILLVTSAYHSRRALEIFQRELPAYQWSVKGVDDGLSGVEESARLLWWQGVDRWRSMEQKQAAFTPAIQ
jgi:uncharacterized SAM-binding protein YcdF (DUF218 family)